jgi:hypothetical protein
VLLANEVVALIRLRLFRAAVEETVPELLRK